MRDWLYRKTHAARYRRVVDDAHGVVRMALERFPGPIAVGCSGGKDSVAMTHIVASHCRPLLIWNDSGLELPESEGVVRAVAAKLGLNIAIARGVNALERKASLGRAAAQEHAAETDLLCIIEPVKAVLREHKITLEFVGLREDESRNRRMLLRSKGPVWDNKRWGCATAWPMRRWLAADVFAYLDEQALPLHPAYTREEWQERDSIRVSWLWDSNREADGDLAYVRRYYPDVYRKLRDLGCIDGL